MCRTSFILDLHLSNFTYFELTFVELHLFWTYVCRASIILGRGDRRAAVPAPAAAGELIPSELHHPGRYENRAFIHGALYIGSRIGGYI